MGRNKKNSLDAGDECVMSKLIMDGLPRKPPQSSSKDDLWREIKKYRSILHGLRQSMLWTIIQQLRAGGPSLVSPEDLRKLADQMESEFEIDHWKN